MPQRIADPVRSPAARRAPTADSWSRLPVRQRLSLLLALVVVLALTLSGMAAYAFQRVSMNERVDDHLERTVEEVGLLASTGVVPETGQPVASAAELIRLAMMRVRPLEQEGMLGLDAERAALAASDAVELRLEEDPQLVDWALDRVQVEVVTLETVETERATYRAAVVPVGGRSAEDVGALLLAFDMDAETDRLNRAFMGYVSSAVLSTLLALLLGVPLLRRVFAPLEALRDTAAEVSEHDLHRRVTVLGHDDVAELGHGFNAMLDRLEDSFASQRRLLDDVGHEMRTPLTIVQGHLEVMDPEDPDDVRESTRLTLDELALMGRLVDDLLTLAQAERPDFLRPAPTDVAELTEAVFERARALGDRRWSLAGAAHVEAHVDGQRLIQAWLQLAANAVRYSDPGSSVSIGSAVRGGVLRLWVQDAGVGVRPEDREVIFTRFGRGAHGRRTEGSGLGLASVSTIVEGHGGRVTVEPAPRRGSVFTMSLPLEGTPLPRPAGDTADREDLP